MVDKSPTRKDLETQAELANRFGARFNLNVYRHPHPFSKFDYFITSKKNIGVALGEGKGRTYKFTDFDSSKVDLEKYIYMKMCHTHLSTLGGRGLGFVLLEKWADGFYYYKHEKKNEVEIFSRQGGRTRKTRDQNDLKPEVLIPHKFFKEF